jgi:hypothetical protein
MSLPNIFTHIVADSMIDRIQKLSPTTQAKWGKMNVAQMLAHCNVTYEMAFEDKHPKPSFLLRFILKTFVKTGIINEVPYKHNSQTAPAFIIAGARDFEIEKERLIDYIYKSVALGESFFEGKESLSFGKLSSKDWSNMFYKHLDHHFRQFGV